MSSRFAVPTREEAIPAIASQVIGGPVGRYARVGTRGWRPAAAVLSVFSAMFIALGVVQKNHCVNGGWASPPSLWRACYSDLPVAVATPAGSNPWSAVGASSTPPLTAILTWFVHIIVPGGSQLRLQQGMFAWGAAVIALLMAVAIILTASAMPQSPWSAAHIALSPLLITCALISFDALGMMLVAWGLWAWNRGRMPVAGVALIGAFLTRPAMGVVFLACLLVAFARGRIRELGGFFAGALAALFVVFGIMLMCGANPFDCLTSWASSAAMYGSLWYLLTFAGITFGTTTLTVVALLGWVGACGIGFFLARSNKDLNVAAIAILMMVMVIATSRAVPVQAGLWLLPLLAMCGVKWRDHLIWAGVEFAYFVVVWGFIARGSNMVKALTPGWYSFFCGARIVGLFFITRAALSAAECQIDDAPDFVATYPQNSAETAQFA